MKKYIPLTRDEARQYAIEWQNWVNSRNLSTIDFAWWADHFTTIAKQFDLIEEFKENGII